MARKLERGVPMTCGEIAKVLGVSRSRVEQIEAKAIRKCRIAFRAMGVAADVDAMLEELANVTRARE